MIENSYPDHAGVKMTVSATEWNSLLSRKFGDETTNRISPSYTKVTGYWKIEWIYRSALSKKPTERLYSSARARVLSTETAEPMQHSCEQTLQLNATLARQRNSKCTYRA